LVDPGFGVLGGESFSVSELNGLSDVFFDNGFPFSVLVGYLIGGNN